MKKLLLLFPFLFVWLWANAQSQPYTLSATNNFYRADDVVVKQQVEYKDPGSSGGQLVWDFRHLQAIDENYTVEYSSPLNPPQGGLNYPIDGAVEVCGLEHSTRYYYRQTADSLLATGYENNTTFMQYIKPELKLKFPFTYGDTLYSEFEGRGEYGRRLPLYVKGWTRVHADAEGELQLPDGTINRALRVHTVRHYTENKRSAVEITLDTYQWYAQGSRYPVFESVKTTFHDKGAYHFNNEYDNNAPNDTVVFTTSFYCTIAPSEGWEQSPPEGDLGGFEGAAAVFTEANLQPNPVVTTLSIDYKLTRPAQVWFTLHNNQGVLQRSTSPQQQSAGYQHATVNMAGLLTGVYSLYVHVDDMVMQMNVIKQ